MTRILAIGVAAMAVPIILLAAPAGAAPANHARIIGGCRARGDFAVCIASGTARHHPVRIVVHVRATPRQSVSVSWSMVCSKGLGAGSSSGHFNSRTPVNRKLHHPYARPDNCTVSADAQLSRHGRLHVWLTYTS